MIIKQIKAYFELNKLAKSQQTNSYKNIEDIKSDVWDIKALIERRTNEFAIVSEMILQELNELKKQIKELK